MRRHESLSRSTGLLLRATNLFPSDEKHLPDFETKMQVSAPNDWVTLRDFRSDCIRFILPPQLLKESDRGK